jgi:hypothetical protein
MKDKSHLQRIVAMAFGSVVFVYLLLFITSGLAFGTSQTCKCEFITFRYTWWSISIYA